ncbi:MAG TPA: chemotaxis protein CheX [Spirochaetia bacterium]|nr:chemotaxis protein CheX [Spirochaetia bacterium]
MRQEILEALLDAVRQVFRDTEIAIDSVQPGDGLGTDAQVIASVGLTGDLKGILVLRTDIPGAARIVTAMMGGLRVPAEPDKLSEVQLAAVAEISNQIAGRTITLLSERGIHCDITPPAVMCALQMHSLIPDVAESTRQTLLGPFGTLSVFLGIQHAE